MNELVIGSRGSRLAIAQSEWVAERLRQTNPGLDVRIRVIRTRGDVVLDAPLPSIGGKGLFTREIESALMAGEIDAAVHSLKDLPTDLPEGLAIGAVPEREDVRDVLISRTGAGLETLPPGARVGTSSPRRVAQIAARSPDLVVVSVRGNVDTRLAKVLGEDASLDAVVLAAAGLCRLGLADRATEVLDLDVMLPAVGQAALAVQVRAGDARVLAAVGPLDHGPTRQAIEAERAFLRALGGGCQTPVAGCAVIENGLLRLRGMLAREDGTGLRRGEVTGPPGDAAGLGIRLASELSAQGGCESQAR